mmetsp:Transcript_10341/g.21107  ORF Transcript_10341/g.21107 Transcript_10341/m.21107 type:complete len:240 (+) Transcript_10341:826-1545(+)
MALSAEATASHRPSGENRMSVTLRIGPSSVPPLCQCTAGADTSTRLTDTTSQAPLSRPIASRRGSWIGESVAGQLSSKLRLLTAPSMHRVDKRRRPLRSHSRTVPSLPPVAQIAPYNGAATARRMPTWAISIPACTSPPAGSLPGAWPCVSIVHEVAVSRTRMSSEACDPTRRPRFGDQSMARSCAPPSPPLIVARASGMARPVSSTCLSSINSGSHCQPLIMQPLPAERRATSSSGFK